MRESTGYEAVEEAVLQKQTPEDLRILGTLSTSPQYPPLRQIILRLKDAWLAKMGSVEAPIEGVRASQGAIAFANELLDFVEKQAPSAYQKWRTKHEAADDDAPDEP